MIVGLSIFFNHRFLEGLSVLLNLSNSLHYILFHSIFVIIVTSSYFEFKLLFRLIKFFESFKLIIKFFDILL